MKGRTRRMRRSRRQQRKRTRRLRRTRRLQRTQRRRRISRRQRGGAAGAYPEFPSGGVVVRKRTEEEDPKLFDYDNIPNPVSFSLDE